MTKVSAARVAQELRNISEHSRVFVSMPYIPGITPVNMESSGVRSFMDTRMDLERRDGIFRLNEAGLSPLDHGNLYGDGVFEGIRVDRRRILMFREHLKRWFDSAKKVDIEFPYSFEETAEIIVRLCRETLGKEGQSAYLRPVLTRGLGNLGVNPAKCLAPTVYIVCSSIALYPRECYEKGIDVVIARKIRRNDPSHIDPNIKTNNYLNNVLALLETRGSGALETIMLTNDGYVAEATADNLFIAEKIGDRVRLTSPAPQYALVGLTRNLVMQAARELGMDVVENPTLLPTDLVGEHREVFITGTACGLMPIKSVEGLPTSSGHSILDTLRKTVDRLSRENAISFDIDSDESTLERYLSEDSGIYR